MRFVYRALLASAWLMACDGPLQLVVVEADRGDTPGVGGSLGGAVAESGAGGRAGAGKSGTATDGGSISESGRGGAVAGGGQDTSGSAGLAGAGGEPSTDPWDSPALYRASFRSHTQPQQYMRHTEDKGFIALIDVGSVVEKQSASFDVIPGLYNAECVSLRAVNVNGGFFRHAGSRIYLHPAQDTPLFLADATFCIEPGLADAQGVTFRSTNYAERVIHLRNGNELWIDDVIADDATFASESTFYREAPLSERD